MKYEIGEDNMKIKKINFLVLSLLLSLSIFPISSIASPKNNDIIQQCSIEEFISEFDVEQAPTNEDGSKTIRITDPTILEEIEANIGKKYPDKNLREIEVKVFPEPEINDYDDKITPQALVSVRRTGTHNACGSSYLRRSTGTGTFSMEISESVTTEVNAGFGVNLKAINASLGTSIKSTMSVVDSTSYTPPRGELGVIEAYASLRIIDFDVYYLGVKAGTGNVMYAVGVCWYKYY